MHYYTLAITMLASSIPALAASMAEVETNELFARDPAIGFKLCTSPIVNLFAYSNSNCTTGYIQGIAEMRNSPIYFGLKFAPAPPPTLLGILPARKFESQCKNQTARTINQDPARSLAYIADGALMENCQLKVYSQHSCLGTAARAFNLNGPYGDGGELGWCEAIAWRSAKVFCDKDKKNTITTFD